MTALIKRQRAAQACVDAFLHRPLKFGVHDCIRLASFNCRKLGIAVPDMKGLKYRSEAGALKALKAKGYADLIEAVDAMGFARIAPAMAWPADIVAIASGKEGPFHAGLTVALGNNALLGFADVDGQQFGAVIRDPSFRYLAAWRVA